MKKLSKKTMLSSLSLALLGAFHANASINPDVLLQHSQTKVHPNEILKVVPTSANPYTSIRPDNSVGDYAFWDTRNYMLAMKAASNNPEAKIKITGNKGPGTITLSKFGTGPSQANTAQISGVFDLPSRGVLTQDAEDEGSILLATDTGLTSGSSVVVNGFIGDGPFGSAGTQSGDFDFYAVKDVAQGDLISIQINTPLPFDALDPFVVLYNEAGEILAFNDDSRGTFDSELIFVAPADDNYYFSVGTFNNRILLNPFDSSTGRGFIFGNEGEYSAVISRNFFDEKIVSFTPKKGDVVGAALNGVSGELALIDKTDTLRQGSLSATASVFDTGSPLPAGGVSVAHVVDESGLFTLRVRGFESGTFTLDIGAHLPALSSAEQGAEQIVFLDFDGATVDLSESIFSGFPFPVIRTLSPLSAFLPSWGLTAADEDAVIDAIVERVEESLVRDIAQLGPNPKFSIRLLNSRDHDDPWGQPNVSRVIVGGTIPELGINTIGIAQSIDVGNYDTEETAFVLLDVLSGQLSSSINLNNFERAPGETIIDIIGVGVGEITAHEAGHYLGSWHTDQFNDVANIMDQGGNLTFSILGLGPDGIFGSADDTNVEFVRDEFNPNESFTGIEDVQSAIAYGSTTPKVSQSKGKNK